MIDEIYIKNKNKRIQIAGLEKGNLNEFVIVDRNEASEGNIYLGKITKKIKTANGKNAYFVNIGTKRDAFINDSEKYLEDLEANEGQNVVVEVIQEQRAEKGARIARFINLAGINLVYCPYGSDINISSKIEDEEIRTRLFEIINNLDCSGGWIIRTNAKNTTEEVMVEEAQKLKNLFDNILIKAKNSKAPELLYQRENIVEEMIIKNKDNLQRVVVDNHLDEEKIKSLFDVEYSTNVFEEAGIYDKLLEALQKEVKLKSGGRIIIEETRAMVAIDVDSGEGNLQGGIGLLNEEAAEEIARQIKLRNLSGKIIIDFAGVSEYKFLKKVMNILEQGLADDYAKSSVLGLSRAGNVEVVRSRKRPSLSNLLTEECSTCQGTGRVEYEMSDL